MMSLRRWVGRRARQAAAAVLVRPTSCSGLYSTRRGTGPASGLCIVSSGLFSQSIGRCYLEFLRVLPKGVLGVFSVKGRV